VNHKLQQERSPLAYEILAYLASHPEAQDTLEGIVHWWLLEQEIKHWAAEVNAALRDLVADGLVIEEHGADGRIHYRLNRSLAGEISRLLKEQSRRETDDPLT
jgi:trehalose-6-phosphatase